MQWLSTFLQAFAKPFKWWIVIASWEQGLRVRLGKRTTRLDPGVHMRIPFLDRIYVQSSRTRVASTEGHSISSKDGQVVTISLAVRYRIRDIVAVYEAASQPEAALMFEALSAASSYIAARTIENITPEEVEDVVSNAAQAVDMGFCDVKASLVGFCVARCYRLISGMHYLNHGATLDGENDNGERR